VRSPAPEEKGAAEMMCDELTATPFPIPMCHCRGGGREFWSKVEPGRKGGVRGRCSRFRFYFSLSYSDFEW